jgi:hypothetical protein
MPQERPYPLRRARPGLTEIASDLEFIKAQLAQLPCRVQTSFSSAGDVDSGQASDGALYREMANRLRAVARDCRLRIAQRELLTLARRYDRRADHLDQKASESVGAAAGE